MQLRQLGSAWANPRKLDISSKLNLLSRCVTLARLDSLRILEFWLHTLSTAIIYEVFSPRLRLYELQGTFYKLLPGYNFAFLTVFGLSTPLSSFTAAIHLSDNSVCPFLLFPVSTVYQNSCSCFHLTISVSNHSEAI